MDNTKIIYERLSDKVIDQLAQNRVIVSSKDFNLKRGSRTEKDRLYPIVGGVYDSNIFGSLYIDTCNCGHIDVVGELCPKCGSRVLPMKERHRRYAKIELDFPYVLGTKTKALLDFVIELPLICVKAQEHLNFKVLTKNSVVKMMEICQFNYDEETETIEATPEITDESYASYEGLEKILKEHFPDKLENYSSIINRKILVTPAITRGVSYDPFNPMSNLAIPFVSAFFSNCVFVKEYITEQLSFTLDPAERVLIKAMARRFYSGLAIQTSETVLPSKQNNLRGTYSDRVDNSGRAPIVGDPELAIDEVKIPIHLAYEICRADFIEYLADAKFEGNLIKAEFEYRNPSKETLELFASYAPTRRVLVNRPPTLHRYNIMAFKMLVTEDSAMHFPITSVEPFAGDFDGDAMAFFLVPKTFNQLVDENASPKTQLRYDSTEGFIWKPNQEMLFGLSLATKIDPTNKPVGSYDAFEDAEKDFDDQVIEYPTDTIIFRGVETTYSRVKLSQIIGTDIEDIYPNTFANSSNIDLLLDYLYKLPNFTEVYQKVVAYALEVVTLEGATIPSLVDILSVDYDKFTAELKELITKAKQDPKYVYELESKYREFISKKQSELPEDIANRFKLSGRIKIQQVMDMICPQLIIDDHGEYYLMENSLAKGLTEEDLRRHATNNRAILQAKQVQTPNSGYANRQLILPGQGIKFYSEGEDKNNTGILLPRNVCNGRTTVEGELLEQSDSTELVRVRSFAVSNQSFITPDLISQVNIQPANESNIGLKFIESLAGKFTQSALSLKHNGTMKQLDQDFVLIAPEDCEVSRVSSDMIVVKTASKECTHFVPSDFELANDNKVKKGSPIGFCPRYKYPGKNTMGFIDLFGAVSTEDIGRGKREMNYRNCISPVEGVIHYTNEYVEIGNFKMPRYTDTVYYFLEGTPIKRYQRICEGVLDCSSYSQDSRISNEDYYGCFRTNAKELVGDLVEHVIEYAFTVINSMDLETGKYNFVGVKGKTKKDKSIITNLSYEGQKGLIENILVEPMIQEESNKDTDLFQRFFINMLTPNL